jgi:hypothetical protein
MPHRSMREASETDMERRAFCLNLTIYDYARIVKGVTPRRLQLQSLYLAPPKAALLNSLSGETRIPKAVLLREAVDDLLIKHKKLRKAKDIRRTGS